MPTTIWGFFRRRVSPHDDILSLPTPFYIDLERAQIQQAVIACTDINAILPYTQTEISFIDSTEALAIATVKKYMEDGG